jgi:uncharacterized OB-fold protein
MTEPPPKPLPDVDDPIAAPLWAAARAHRFVLQACGCCGYVPWPPARVCPECLSADLHWRPASRSGAVWSSAVYHRALHPAFRDDVPYTVVAVRLDAGPLMIGRIDREPPVGERVEIDFDDVTDDVTLLRFTSGSSG